MGIRKNLKLSYETKGGAVQKKLQKSYVMPTMGFHIRDDSQLEEAIKRRAKRHGGRVSAYVRSLVERDLEGARAGFPDAAYSPEQMRQFAETQVRLRNAAHVALRALSATGDERDNAVKHLAHMVIEMAMQLPMAQQSDAEAFADSIRAAFADAESKARRRSVDNRQGKKAGDAGTEAAK